MALLSQQHRRFLLVDQCIFPALFNFLINGSLFWLLFKDKEAVSLWGSPSIGVDLALTGFLLPFLTAVIVSPLVARQVQVKKLPPITYDQLPGLPIYTRPTVVRGAVLGFASIIFAAFPVILVLDLVKATNILVFEFALYKALWSALLAMVVTPIIAWWALARAS